jgi:hypothetical protein
VHLLRQVFEQCESYAQAKAMLTTTPVCIPVIYTLTGTAPGEGCIIERREHDAVLHEGPACISNHWLDDTFKGRPRRGRNSRTRLSAMQKAQSSLGADRFDWLTPPVVDGFTAWPRNWTPVHSIWSCGAGTARRRKRESSRSKTKPDTGQSDESGQGGLPVITRSHRPVGRPALDETSPHRHGRACPGLSPPSVAAECHDRRP